MGLCSQLSDGHSLFDYDVGLNDIIQIFVRPLPEELNDASDSSPKSSSEEKMETVSSTRNSYESFEGHIKCF